MEGWGVSLDQQTNKQTKRKPSVARKKLEKPSRAMRDAALRTLHGVVTDSATPVYVKVSAAKALLREDGTEGDEIDSPTGPPVLLVIPDNGRDPGLATLGVDRSPGGFDIISVEFLRRNRGGARVLMLSLGRRSASFTV
jgi:hypothetical protein